MSAIQTISDYVHGTADAFNNALVDRSMNFEREAGFAIQILTAGDYIAKLAVNDRQSVVNAVTNIAAIGVSLNPAKKQAYLVPRKGKICLDISYIGLIDLALQSGSVQWAQAALVHESDAFALNGYDKPPMHSYNPFSSDRGPVVGAYVVIKTQAGDYLTECMSRKDIDDIKNRSESVKAGKSSPWDTDYGEMAKKTVTKRAYKYWPKTERLSQAIEYLNTDGGERLAVSAAPVAEIDAQPIIDEVRQIKTVESLNKYWAENNGFIAKDIAAHNRLKVACKDQKTKLQNQQATDVEVKNAVS